MSYPTRSLPKTSRLGVVCLVMIFSMAMSLQGCSWFKKKSVPVETSVVETPVEYTPQATTEPVSEGIQPPAPPPAESPRPTGLRPTGVMKVIYFDYNKSEIRPDQFERIDSNLRYLLENGEVKVLVEGHCDDRGTTEYNFALGERRARGVADFFIQNGVNVRRIQILSKGEEEPAVDGHDDETWSLNRRCEFKFFD